MAIGVLLASTSAAPVPARAATPAEDERESAAWVGRYCRASTGSAIGDAAGFAIAAGAVALLARRRRA